MGIEKTEGPGNPAHIRRKENEYEHNHSKRGQRIQGTEI
jgi:hypothetical protein